jgi:hypothetical protein
MSQPIIVLNFYTYTTFTAKKGSKLWAKFYKKPNKVKAAQSPKFAQSGVDVMITIFCDFCQFFVEKFGVFIKKTLL